MYEIDATPEEFANDIEAAFWATVTPAERRMLHQDYDQRGRDAIRTRIDDQLRDDLEDRDAYVEAFTDAIEASLDT